MLAYLRSPSTADHVASLPHAAIPVHLKPLLIPRDEAAYLGPSELVELCTTERRRTPKVYLTQLMRNPSHVHTHTWGASHGSMHSMGTVRERDEDGPATQVCAVLSVGDSSLIGITGFTAPFPRSHLGFAFLTAYCTLEMI